MDAPNHLHLLLHVDLNDPPADPDVLREWLRRVVDAIEMKILDGPHACYTDVPGNEGATGIVVIETSHCSIHAWHKVAQPYAMIDVYSCREFDYLKVIDEANQFGIVRGDFVLMDRNYRPAKMVDEGIFGDWPNGSR